MKHRSDSRAGDGATPRPLRTIEALAPTELARRLAAGEDFVLLDVREPRELALCQLPGSTAIPLGALEQRLPDLDPERPTVCICHHGVRSAHAAARLAAAGFHTVFNLSGGIERWAAEVDPSMRRY